jgi:hypothetical protein
MCRLVTCINGGLRRSAGNVWRCHCASGPTADWVGRGCLAPCMSRLPDCMLACVEQVWGHPARDETRVAWRCSERKDDARGWRRAWVPAIPERRIPARGRSTDGAKSGWSGLRVPNNCGRMGSQYPRSGVLSSLTGQHLRSSYSFSGMAGVQLFERRRIASSCVWLMQHAAARLLQPPSQRPSGVSCAPRPRLSHVLTASSKNTLFLRLRLRPILFSSSPLPRAPRSLAPV